MAKKHRMPDMKEGNVNVTPLIDVVMCLIIFFMLVAKIGVSTGIDDKIDAPATYLGVDIKDMDNALALNLYPKTDPNTGNRRLDDDAPQVLVDLKGEKKKELSFQENRGGKIVHPLREVLQEMKQARGERFKVIVNAQKDMRYAQIQLVLQACAEAGVTNVNFATRKTTQVVTAPG